MGTYRDFVHRHETERDFEFGVRFDLEGTEDLSPLVRKIIESVSATKAGLSVQFSGKEKRPLQRIDLATGDQRQAIISYHPARGQSLEDERCNLVNRLHALSKETKNEEVEAVSSEEAQIIHNLELLVDREAIKKHGWEEVEVKPDSEIWRHWWECTKSYIREELDGGEDVRLREYDDEDEFFEELEDYQFEDAIKDIGYASNSLRSTIVYKNFLPESHDPEGIDSPFQVPYFYSLHDEYIDGLDISPFTLHMCSTLRRLLGDLTYLGPLRSHPERHYTFSGDTPNYVG